MDYRRIYQELVQRRRQESFVGYTENHHIVPRSLGGLDDPSNLVRLSGREHFIAHLLLHKIHRNDKTAYALWMMQCKSKFHEDRAHIKNSRMYEWARKEFSKFVSNHNRQFRGNRNSQFGTRWICNLELKQNRKISKDDPIPAGWITGRIKTSEKHKIRLELRQRKLSLIEELNSSGIDFTRRGWVNAVAVKIFKKKHGNSNVRKWVETNAPHLLKNSHFSPKKPNGSGARLRNEI